jgi:hypothetical protein
MIFLVVVYSLAIIGFLVVAAVITLFIISLWYDITFSLSNKPGEKRNARPPKAP